MPDGPYGEFTGHLSGCRLMCSVEIKKIYHRKNPVYEYCAIGMPWTEIDYMFINTGAALYVQLKNSFPEIVDVNALYTHGLVVIVSTEMRVGGFAKTVGMSVLQTPHGTGYAKVVIIVDADVDPFNSASGDVGVVHEVQSEVRLHDRAEPLGPGVGSRLRSRSASPTRSSWTPPRRRRQMITATTPCRSTIRPKPSDWLPKIQELDQEPHERK